MNNYPTTVKEKLYSLIDDLANYSWLYCTDPCHHFLRKRKLDFATTMKLIIAMEGGTLSEEMMEFWDYDLSCPTVPAFVQQRPYIKPDAFRQLLSDFNNAFPRNDYLDGYKLLACDGSQVVYTTNPEIIEDFTPAPAGTDVSGHNSLHLNALYDIIGRVYVDAMIQPGVDKNEHAALHSMIDSYLPDDPSHTIITVDRGYESYNLIAQFLSRGMLFVMRARTPAGSNSILSSFKNELPMEEEEFSVDVSRYITRSLRKKMRTQPDVYLELTAEKNFDYASSHAKGKDFLYYMAFRAVKIKLGKNNYEYLITNLPEYDFPIDRLKEIYHLRWKIETSFLQLKYAVGMMNFHSKKVECIKQEIFAKLIVYNFSEIIASHASISKNNKKNTKHKYMLNYSMAARICHKFLKRPIHTSPPDIIGWIQRNLTVQKSYERSFPRKPRGIGAVNFIYRTT